MTALYRLSYQAAETVLRLRQPRIALDLPLRGFPTEPPVRIRQAFLEGFLAELQRGWPEASFTVSLLPPEQGGGWAEEERGNRPQSQDHSRKHRSRE
jgi:hypothetical protein